MDSGAPSLVKWIAGLPQTTEYISAAGAYTSVYPVLSSLMLHEVNLPCPEADVASTLKGRLTRGSTLFKGPLMMMLAPGAFVAVDQIRERAQGIGRRKGVSLKAKLGIDFTVGGIFGGFVANPAQVALSTAHKENTGLINALRRVCSYSVLPNLWRGTVPQVLTMGSMSVAAFSGYDTVHARALEKFNSPTAAHFVAGTTCGVLAGVGTTPLAVAATLRHADIDRKLAASAYQALKQAWKGGGVAGLGQSALLRSSACAAFILIYRGVKEQLSDRQ